MIFFQVLLIIFVMGLLLYSSSRNESLTNGSAKLPYNRKNYIMSVPEHAFFNTLEVLLAEKYYIFPQLNLDKLIYVQKGTGNYFSHYRRINQYSVDFVICSKTTISPLLAIELDDSSHSKPDRQNRDRVVNSALDDAGLPVLRIPLQQSYDLDMLSKLIEEKIG